MLYVIVGPTASGKTEAACWLARHLKAPLVNADAFQVYKGMNIGTNKNLSEFHDIPHYLFDVVEPSDGFTVAQYKLAFDRLMNELKPNIHPVVVVGGTGMYVKATLYDFPLLPIVQNVDMTKYEAMENQPLFELLQEMDPPSAARIHPHNRRRVLRAIEIKLTTGKRKSDIEASQSYQLRYPTQFFGLNPPREEVYARINQRVVNMVEQGLFDEVEQLLTTTPEHAYAFDAIGYKQTIPYLKGVQTKAETIEAIQQATRRYAKRQWTYFLNQLPVVWYPSLVAFKEGFLRG